MGLIVNFSDFENKTGNTLSASDYLVGFTSGPDREIKISIHDFISYIESTSANDLYTILNQNSSNWNGTYISVSPNSGYWDSVYTTVNTVSSSWTTGGTSLLTVLNYLSSNLVILSAASVTQNLVVSGDVTIFGNLSALGTTFFTNVSYVTSISANFNELFVSSLTATNITNNKLNSTYTTLNQNSSVGGSVYTTLNQNSAKYDSTYTTLNQNSSIGGSVYTTTNNNSAFWSQAYTNLVTNSAAYLLSGSNTVLGNIPSVSANWDNTYTQFSSNSATYATIGFVNGNFVPISGGNINGDLTVSGNLTALGTFTFLDTIVTVTSALSVYNAGTGPALTVQQTGNEPVARFFDSESGDALYIANNGRIGIGTANPDTLLFVAGTTYVEEIKEKVTLSASRANSTVNFDILTQSVLFLTLSSSGNWIVNFRGDNNTSLNSIMSAGQSFTCVSIVSTGTTVYYNSAVQIDGTTFTPLYLNGLTPQAVVSNTRALQNYAYTIIKRGNAVFNVLASVNEYY
jgi:hypothetical protein